MSSFFDSQLSADFSTGFVGCLYAALFADGDSNELEINRVAAHSNRKGIVSDEAFSVTVKEVSAILSVKGNDFLREYSAKHIPEEWAPTVFASCCDVIFADNEITDIERAFLKNLKTDLKLTDEIVDKIIDVMMILYKGKLH